MAEAHRNGSVFSRLSVTPLGRAAKLVRVSWPRPRSRSTSNLSMIKPLRDQRPGGQFLLLRVSSPARISEMRGRRGGPPRARRRRRLRESDFSHGTNFARRSLVGLHMAEGNGELALEAAEDLERHSVRTREPALDALAIPEGGGAGRCSGGARRRSPSLEDEVAIAREWGTPSGLGHSLRVLGELRGPEGLDELEEAARAARVARTSASSARGRFAALGAEVRRARRPTEAREPLRRALELAEQGGARLLARERSLRALRHRSAPAHHRA